MRCGRVRDWLHRDVETLDDATRLQLDDHLAGCIRCRGDREHLRRVRQLGESLAVPAPGARVYNRAIARALLERSPRPVVPARPRVWIPMAAFAALATIALVTVVVLRARGADPTDARTATPTVPDRGSATPPAPDLAADPGASDVAVVDEGVVRAGPTVLGAGDVLPADTLLRADASARLRLGSARAELIGGAELRWLPGPRRLVLARGGFVVELHDADVTIEPTVVRVARGQVTIFASSSDVVVARLEAGATWSLDAPARPPRARAAAPPPTFAELMALARRQFTARQYVLAARTTEDALALSPRRSDAAEARTFLGDIAQATGDLALAARRYAAVADSLDGEPAAESALYAAARVELRRGRTAPARALLVRYLDRHPVGRYADDVRRELDALPPSP
jgi:hypothetical protein